MDFAERLYWHNNSYGRALRIHKNTLRALFITLCLLTPATNWLIPLSHKTIKTDLVIRYDPHPYT